jgi:AraC family transcriptional regulator, transcriptional activator of pobA
MKSKETTADFHQRLINNNSDPGKFNIYSSDDHYGSVPLPHNRRDFYKISLVLNGGGMLSYAHKTFHIKDNIIAFFNPMIPYSWEPLTDAHKTYSCLFTEDFVNQGMKSGNLSNSPLFKVSGNHILQPDEKSMVFLKSLFEQMNVEMQSSYINKYDLLRSYVQIIMHEALKIAPVHNHHKEGTSSARISELFLELLERQFPVPSLRHTIHFKNANEFAGQLAIHTNHLNRALKETTGKTTTEHIADRIVNEAKALLINSNWGIGDIGYCLGFEHASNFNIFFKKQTGLPPSQFRKQPVSIS